MSCKMTMLRIDTNFHVLLDKIGILQPKWKELQNLKSAFEFCEQLGYPFLAKSSYFFK